MKGPTPTILSAALCAAFVHLLVTDSSRAGDATWLLDPVNNTWNNPDNWMPNTVPHLQDDVATLRRFEYDRDLVVEFHQSRSPDI